MNIASYESFIYFIHISQMIDSDTAVDPPSLKQLVYEMNRRSDIASCCGETEVRETEEGLSWIQKVQKWEYWASHNINKSIYLFIFTHSLDIDFQSAFGSVTCLPGCFSLHRVDDLVSNNYILEQFERSPSKGSIVESNLLELGEDRYLTLLLLIWHVRFLSYLSIHYIPVPALFS